MKEVSLLLGLLCQSLPLQTDLDAPQGLITVEQVTLQKVLLKILKTFLCSCHEICIQCPVIPFLPLRGLWITLWF